MPPLPADPFRPRPPRAQRRAAAGHAHPHAGSASGGRVSNAEHPQVRGDAPDPLTASDPYLDSDAPVPPEPRSAGGGRSRQWDVLAAIAVGGGLGSLARYGLARALPTTGGGFPWATFTANVTGSLLLGLLMVYVLEVWPPSRYRRPFLGVGFIGGFTTFSTYEVELRGLLAAGRFSLADAYALTSLLAGLAAVWTGVVLARRVSGLPVRRGPRRRDQAGRTAGTSAQPKERASR